VHTPSQDEPLSPPAESTPQASSETPAPPEPPAANSAAPEISPPTELSALAASAQQPSAPATPPREYSDRSTGLTVFGIIQILLGLLAMLGIPFILLSALVSLKTTGSRMPVGSYLQGMSSYALMAALLITLGIGSLRARRWAWAITLITSWIWLIVGIVMTVMMTAVMPTAVVAAMKATGSAAPMSRGVIAVVLTLIIVLFAVLLIATPAAFLIFYHRKDVEETCKRRDPHERWTDRCPLPVLAVSLIFSYAVVYYALDSFTVPIIPFFGRWLTGWQGALACLLLGALDAFIAISIFRLKIVGWWVALTALAVRLISSILTLLRGNLFEAYSKMGMPQKQLEMMGSNPAMRSGVMLWSTLVFTLALLGYLVWIKRYFARAT